MALENDLRRAEWYDSLAGSKVRCTLCPHFCVLGVGEIGLCRSRRNFGGVLYAVNYAQCAALALDSIEKKPLYHYCPATKIISLGPNSCNLSCRFCQNFTISQEKAPTSSLSPDDLAEIIFSKSPDSLQVAFTYTEPLTWYEYILDFAIKYPEIHIVLVTNGFINQEPLLKLLPFIKAMNIDLKAMHDDFYKDQCGASLEPVLATIAEAYRKGVHVEITNLLIPVLNNDAEEIRKLAKYIAGIDVHIPLHISAYHPDYMAEQPATTHADVIIACEIAQEQLKHVYAGNIADDLHSATYCPECGEKLISRSWYAVSGDLSGICPNCNERLYGVFSC
ncbi:MAG TPA: AmmeMemoRadiSam system radical SAM enzyme [Candidatus Cloacimonadota bacterium]|nr:AmmeMemoRadiSam system radical SAM enzyme [Candidatus Cloacimonadota bacterium]